ncbi:pilus assembly protein TadG-related protein [Zavarzinia compransoris]|uniref:pilus assembly protein TadG-related protein n=1 Tax=Zavarzinia marina TaxID=2911065 RepID=UPI001F23C219|nr:pilus assembly protein TadG-related protein [Zavarzinia marina]MCF4166899.1 pilus assembly protein TadG-related protein [Zavarzinia marina]
MRIFGAGTARDERGAAAIILAIALPLLILATAFVVDLGYGYFEKQRLQDALDLAAMSAARELDGGADERGRARTAAVATLDDNGFDVAAIDRMLFGRYRAGRPVGSRFQAEADTGTSPNAVQIQGVSSSPRFFSRMIDDGDLGVDAVSTAMTTGRLAVVRIGSGLAELKGGLLNAILGALLGGNVDLTVLDYNGLLGANIELLSFLDEYAIRVGLEAGDYDGLLSADVSVLGVLGVVADIAHNAYDGDPTAIALGIGLGDAFPGINKLPLLDIENVNIKLGDLLGIGIGTVDSGLAIPINVFDLITAGIFAASTTPNETGQHALGVSLDTFLGASLHVSIVEPPQPPTGYRVITEEDIRNGDNLLRTSQIRLLLRVDWQGPLTGVLYLVNGILDALQILGLDVDLLPTYGPNANENLSIGVNVGYGEVRVTELGCEAEDGPDRHVGMDVDTGAVSAHVGQIDPDDFLSNDTEAHADPFRVLGLSYNLWGLINPPIDILSVDIGVNLPVGAPTASIDMAASDLTDGEAFADLAALFDQPGQAPDSEAFPSSASIGTTDIITTLGQNLRDALGLQLGGYLGEYVLQPLVDLVTLLVGDFLIGTVLGPLLDALVDLLLDILGIRVGTTDVAVIDLSCGTPRLVLP